MVNWGKSCETGKIPQPEATEKQAGWGKSCEIGKIPQPEAAGKQAGWGKSCETGKIPQPEAIEKQAGWGKVEKSGKSPNRKLLRSKRIGGKVVKSGKSPKLKKGLTAGTLYANITALCEESPTGEACIRMERKGARKVEKETRELLLASAKQEFLEKGYQGASLRSICKNAGVTTGALYFFFQDKEDLFAAIVEPVLEKLKHMLQQHMRQELMELQQLPDAREDNMQDDMFASAQIIHLLYANYDMFTLILTKSQGSRFENCVDEFVAIMENGYQIFASEQAKVLGVEPPDEYTLHWVAHVQINAFSHLLLHEKDEQKALKHMEQVMNYLLGGWNAMFQNQ